MTRAAWPRSLFGRLVLLLGLGLALAHGLTFALVLTERGMTMQRAMVSYFASDVASAVALFDRLPAADRNAWLDRLARPNHHYALAPLQPASPSPSDIARRLAGAVAGALPAGRTARIVDPRQAGIALRLQVPLADGTALAVDVVELPVRVSRWVLAALVLQLAVLLGLCAWAVRAATRPLNVLADAADALGADRPTRRLAETGPVEVMRASAAFNRMQERIQAHLRERLQILAAVAHDLQTPITRMRLRAELLDDAALRDKLQADLAEMQALVEEGVAYARVPQAAREPLQRVDLRALVECLAEDYADAGQPVRVARAIDMTRSTRPQALRRLLCNLIDNALKFAGSAELVLEPAGDHHWCVKVLDRGPGIPAASLSSVVQPFVRLEDSRSRQSGGTGLGLAIAAELAKALDGELVLGARDDKLPGLQAEVRVQVLTLQPVADAA